MIKRKLMLDQNTIKAYKRLVKTEITTPETVPEITALMPYTPQKRRGAYFIYTNTGIKELTGWIMTVDGLEVGCNKPGDYSPYNITDLKSGVIIGKARTLKNVPDEVYKISDIVKKKHADLLDKNWRKMIKAIKAAYKAA